MLTFLRNSFFLFQLLSTCIVTAQDDSSRQSFRKRINVSIGIGIPMAQEWNVKHGYSLLSPITIEYKKHLLALSPVWIIDKNEELKSFSGCNVTYQMAPFHTPKRLNLYLVYEMMFIAQKNSWRRAMLLDNTDTYYHVEYEARWKSFRHQLGYGITFRILPRLFLDQSLSTGINIYSYKSEFHVEDQPELSQYYTLSLFRNSKPSSFIKFGIRYRIVKTQSK